MRLFLLTLLALSGCAATQIPYSPTISENRNDASKIIEQVVMEQPTKHRPDSIVIGEDYIGFNEGFESKTSGFASGTYIGGGSTIASGFSRTKTRSVGDRLYFNSIGSSALYAKRDWYIIQVKNRSGKVVKRFYTRSKIKAESFIDAMFYLSVHSDPIK